MAKREIITRIWRNWNFASGNVTWWSNFGKQFGSSPRCWTKSYHVTQQFHSLCIYPREIKWPQKNLYTNACGNTIYNMSTKRWLKKQNTIYPYNEILFSYKKEWNIDTWYNMYEPWKPVMWQKPVTKDHMLYDPIYIKCQEEINLYRQK